jgi:hypothetical protein
MSTPISISIPHQLGRAEARRRIDTGFGNVFRQLPGWSGNHSQHWDGDRLEFKLVAMGQTLSGVVDVQDASVDMQIELPGVLGLIAGGLKGRLRQAGQLLLTRK